MELKQMATMMFMKDIRHGNSSPLICPMTSSAQLGLVPPHRVRRDPIQSGMFEDSDRTESSIASTADVKRLTGNHVDDGGKVAGDVMDVGVFGPGCWTPR